MPADIQLEEDEVRVIGGSLIVETEDGDELLRVDGTDGSLQFAVGDSPLLYVFEDEEETENRPVIARSPEYPGYGILYRDERDRIIFQGDDEPVLTTELANRMVGIGTDDPEYDLHVEGAVAGTESYKTLSDARLKRAVEPIGDALSTLSDVHGVSYELDTDAPGSRHTNAESERRLGFVAQDLADAVPEVVDEGSDGTKMVELGSIVPLLVEALREQQEHLETQADAIENMRERINALEATDND